MDHFRRTSSLVRLEGPDSDNREDGEGPAYEPCATGEEPAEMFSRAHVKTAVDAALAALPPEQKEVVLLREYAGLSFKEIAQATNAPLGTVLARMSRAVAKLKIALGKDYERA